MANGTNDSLRAGPFPNRVDPWAEQGRYFQQLHAQMIGRLVSDLNDRLLPDGYFAGQEASLQIAAGREPDLYVQWMHPGREERSSFDYALAAEETLAAPGIALDERPRLKGVQIYERASGHLVTVVEIISPRNKSAAHTIHAYRDRRAELVLRAGINVVELDLTRSVQRLLNADLTRQTAYHFAVFLPDDLPRIVPIALSAALPRVALPLRGEVVPVELAPLYRDSYRGLRLAQQMHVEERYGDAHLPFPSTLPEAERAQMLATVRDWQASLSPG